MVHKSLEPGQSVSVAARCNGINANQLFLWSKLYQEAACRQSAPVKPSFRPLS